jgi:hypothetical protein
VTSTCVDYSLSGMFYAKLTLEGDGHAHRYANG